MPGKVSFLLFSLKNVEVIINITTIYFKTFEVKLHSHDIIPKLMNNSKTNKKLCKSCNFFILNKNYNYQNPDNSYIS